jgi:hypothetical protein
VRREVLHLLRDFSQSGILRHMSGNSADISKGYFEKPTRAALDPLLRDIAPQGPWVSAHPDVILKMGVKDVLYRTRHLAGAPIRCHNLAADDDQSLSPDAPDSRLCTRDLRGS